ncbi:MAG: hypothetical protein HY820_42485 [Acidobacteria bacterium]|nr:hypothetical protein [Acidobacteriota bacterium]
MRNYVLIAAVLGLGAWLVAQNTATPKPLANLTPAGAVLYLEAKNLSGLLGDWNASGEKKTWLASANYEVFSRSQLYLKLSQVFSEYADGVGVAPDMTLLSSVAGGQSALAFYDINRLEFLYLTRLPSARAMQSVLWRAKEKFAARNAAGTAYYIKTEPAKKRTAAFAISGDLLLIATKEDALVNALALLSGASTPNITSEPWYQTATGASAGAGDLRMVTNMERLLRAPAFRSYWVQRNGEELAQFTAGVGDLTRSAREVKEDRVLLRANAVEAPDTTAVPSLLRLSANAALYRVHAQPSPSAVMNAVVRKVLRQGGRALAESKIAPGAAGEGEQAGDANDFETRLDGAPMEQTGAVFRPQRLQRALESNRVRAMLHLESPGTTPDRVFVNTSAVVALEGAGEWNAAELRDALSDAVEGLYTTSKIGVGWHQRGTVWQIDGLARVAMMVQGRTLLLASRAEALDPLVPLLAVAPDASSAASYAAGYRVAGQLNSFVRHMTLIEFPQTGQGDSNEPAFFSGNLASLVRTLQRVQTVRITARDDGRMLKQTVTYHLP